MKVIKNQQRPVKWLFKIYLIKLSKIWNVQREYYSDAIGMKGDYQYAFIHNVQNSFNSRVNETFICEVSTDKFLMLGFHSVRTFT